MLILLPIAAAAAPVAALETDQFYAWKRPLKDATEAINAKINADIDAVLGEVNSRRETDGPTCAAVQKAIRRRFKYLIFPKPELWATKTSLLERVPASGEEEFAFRRAYLFRRHVAPRSDPVHAAEPDDRGERSADRDGQAEPFFSEGPGCSACTVATCATACRTRRRSSAP
jgi:hypothetical protein